MAEPNRRVKQLAELLACYESDEPYVGEFADDAPPANGWTWDSIKQALTAEHFGDCTGAPNTCERCVAEHILHKARWLAERLDD